MEITTLRLVLRRGFVLSEYVSGDYSVCLRERGERIPMPELCPETNGQKEREVEEKRAPSLVVGGGLYRVRHPLTSYVTKWGIEAIMSDDASTALSTVGLRISE